VGDRGAVPEPADVWEPDAQGLCRVDRQAGPQFDFLTGKDKENILGGNAVQSLGLA
jgi:hypothetical protein